MDSLDRLISKNIKKAGASRQVRTAMVLDLTKAQLCDFFGEDLAILMRPTAMRNGVITIRCTNSSCAQEIALNEKELLGKINPSLGDGTPVSRLRATN